MAEAVDKFIYVVGLLFSLSIVCLLIGLAAMLIADNTPKAKAHRRQMEIWRAQEEMGLRYREDE